jgi:hypothetical protein
VVARQRHVAHVVVAAPTARQKPAARHDGEPEETEAQAELEQRHVGAV